MASRRSTSLANTKHGDREMLEIVSRVTAWAGGKHQAMAWYRAQAEQPGEPNHAPTAVGGGRYCVIGGGVPLRDGRRVIAGVGVCGGRPEEDVAIVEAVLSAFARGPDPARPSRLQLAKRDAAAPWRGRTGGGRRRIISEWEPFMSQVQVEQKIYEMPPRDGFSIAHFLTVADIGRSADFYEKVFGGRILSRGDSEGAPGYIQIANTWLIVNVGGGPTPDKPSVTLSAPIDPDAVSSFMNIRVADIHACYDLWRSRGAEFITEPKPKYAETRCYIRDPDGYIIEVGQSDPGIAYG